MTIQQHASFDSSAAELNATSKLVKAWESKNAKKRSQSRWHLNDGSVACSLWRFVNNDNCD
jgi:hypothetical protein